MLSRHGSRQSRPLFSASLSMQVILSHTRRRWVACPVVSRLGVGGGGRPLLASLPVVRCYGLVRCGLGCCPVSLRCTGFVLGTYIKRKGAVYLALSQKNFMKVLFHNFMALQGKLQKVENGTFLALGASFNYCGAVLVLACASVGLLVGF